MINNICSQFGVRDDNPVLIRRSINEVYDTGDGHIVRVTKRGDADKMSQYLESYITLAERGAPIIAPTTSQVIVDGDNKATLWPKEKPIPNVKTEENMGKLGATLRKLHDTDVKGMITPDFSPMLPLEERLEVIREHELPGADFLESLADQLGGFLIVGKTVLTHGDVHTKNMVEKNGELMFIDLDDMCHGPSSFDYATALNIIKRGSHPDSREEKESMMKSFMDAYGEVEYEPMELFHMGVIRDLLSVSWLGVICSWDETRIEEYRSRLWSMTDYDLTMDWKEF